MTIFLPIFFKILQYFIITAIKQKHYYLLDRNTWFSESEVTERTLYIHSHQPLHLLAIHRSLNPTSQQMNRYNTIIELPLIAF